MNEEDSERDCASLEEEEEEEESLFRADAVNWRRRRRKVYSKLTQ